MGDLNREQLADITAQRLQENVARKNRQIGKQIEDANSEITTLKSQIASIQSFKDLTLNFSTSGGSASGSHNLGAVPSGWYVIDVTGLIDLDQSYSVRRTSWDSTNISFANSGNSGTIRSFTLKIRVFL